MSSLSSRIALVLVAGAIVCAPGLASAQDAAQADRDLAQAKAEQAAAYKSKNPTAIAAARAKARLAYSRDYGAHHPRDNCSRNAGEASSDLAKARAEEKAGYETHNAAEIAKDRAEARPLFAKAYGDTHGCAGKR